VPGQGAAKAGIRRGDLITAIDGQPVQDPTNLSSAVALKKPGDKITVRIQRNGLTQELDVTLGIRPQKTP
jgi:S1-C subfamily serine protease